MRIHHMENVKKALDFMKYKKVRKLVLGRMVEYPIICSLSDVILIF